MKKDYRPYGIFAHPNIANKSEYIANSITIAINAVKISPCQKLLSYKELARLLGVDPKTVARSYEKLSKAGWIEIRPRVGCFVLSHPPSFPMHKIPLFSEKGFNMPTVGANTNLEDLHGYANFVTIGAENTNPANLYQLKQAPFSKALAQVTKTSAKTWEKHFLNEQNWFDECRYILELKRGMYVDPSSFTISVGSMITRMHVIKLMIKPGAGVLLSCYTDPFVVKSIQDAQATPIFLEPGLHGLKPRDIKEKCKEHFGKPTQIELLYTTPQFEYNCDMRAAITAMEQLLSAANSENLKILEEFDSDTPKEIAPPPLCLTASQPVDNIVSINAYSIFEWGLKDIRLIAGPVSFINALNRSLRLKTGICNIVDKKTASLLAQKHTFLNFAIDYEQQLNEWKKKIINDPDLKLQDHFDILIPLGGKSILLIPKSRKEITVDLEMAKTTGIAISHSRQEISSSCTVSAIRVFIGWGYTTALKKCLKILKTFVLTYLLDTSICFI